MLLDCQSTVSHRDNKGWERIVSDQTGASVVCKWSARRTLRAFGFRSAGGRARCSVTGARLNPGHVRRTARRSDKEFARASEAAARVMEDVVRYVIHGTSSQSSRCAPAPPHAGAKDERPDAAQHRADAGGVVGTFSRFRLLLP